MSNMMTDENIFSLAEWLDKHPDLVLTNTPTDVLAAHMLHSLRLFETTLLERSDHPFFNPTDR